MAGGRLGKAIDLHERLGLQADPTQALVLRNYDGPRGELCSYDVLEVNPIPTTGVPPPPSTHMHTHARMRARRTHTHTRT